MFSHTDHSVARSGILQSTTRFMHVYCYKDRGPNKWSDRAVIQLNCACNCAVCEPLERAHLKVKSESALSPTLIDVHRSTIRGALNGTDKHGKAMRTMLLISKKNISACLQFSKDHVDKEKGYKKNASWADETKTELFNLLRSIRQHGFPV